MPRGEFEIAELQALAGQHDQGWLRLGRVLHACVFHVLQMVRRSMSAPNLTPARYFVTSREARNDGFL